MRFVTDFRTELISRLEKVKRKIMFITGYVTIEGFDFVENYLAGKSIEKVIIFKLDLMDFKNGASSFNFKRAVENGWKVYINKTIHAKNYIFDDEIIIQGSSNLTSNGIGLTHNRKDDNNVLWNYNNEFKSWVENKINSSVLINIDNADETDRYVQRIMGEKDLQRIFLRQKVLDNRLAKVQLFTMPSKKINSEDVLILEKVIQSFIKTLKSNPNEFAEAISKDELDGQYKYEENLEWYSKYIIDINQKIKHEAFNCNNKLYKYTSRIYTHDNRYYVEKIYGNPLNVNSKDDVETLLFAIKEMFKAGIAANCCFSDVSINSEKIKFKKFYPVKGVDKRELESIYKSSLLDMCCEREIKALILDFHLGEGQNGVN